MAHEPTPPSGQEAPVDVTGTSCGRDVSGGSQREGRRRARVVVRARRRRAQSLREFVGHDAVLGFYHQYVLANDVSVQATNIIEADTICVVELAGVTPARAEVQRMVDIFTVDEQGQVVRLSISRR